jgi:hypothetical protein
MLYHSTVVENGVRSSIVSLFSAIFIIVTSFYFLETFCLSYYFLPVSEEARFKPLNLGSWEIVLPTNCIATSGHKIPDFETILLHFPHL